MQLELIRPFVKRDGTTLEVGCGSGRFSSALGLYAGIEPSWSLGRIAYQRGLQLIRGDGEYLPIRSLCISQAFLITVLGFVASPVKILSEIRRCLYPSGSLIVVDIDISNETKKANQKDTPSTFLSHAHLYSCSQIHSLLEQSGFLVSDVRQSAGLLMIHGSLK